MRRMTTNIRGKTIKQQSAKKEKMQIYIKNFYLLKTA